VHCTRDRGGMGRRCKAGHNVDVNGGGRRAMAG
jgi:hypothetical protein